MVWAELEAVLPKPEVIAGYSLGELSAYGCAGALASEEVVRLAGIRAHAMDAACPHGALLAVTGLPVEAAEAAARRVECYLAIVVAEDHCVLGGPADRVAALTEAVRVAGSRNITPLAVTVASHTPLLDDAVEPFREALRAVAWSAPCAPVLAGINAVKVLRREQMEEWLPEQMHRTVRWDRILQRLAESDCHVLLELGPGRQLSHMAVAQGLEARSVEEFRSAEGVRVWVEKCLTRGA
jgi:[acyl-carrier-protein] S-malonyltransferase